MRLKTYKITLIAKGPVFVGNGKSYTKKEYFIFNNKVNILDMNKFYGFLYKMKKAPEFEKFMLEGRQNLYQWLNDKNLTKDATKFVRYALNVGRLDDIRNVQIMPCVKDAYGNPYIPGSSLKGALRTILATASIADNENIKSKIRSELESGLYEKTSRTRYLSNASKVAETKIFRTLKRKENKPDDAVNDIMQGFIVGDSEPLSINALTLSQKFDLRVDGKKNKLNILRESLKPETKIVFPLTIDEDICKYSMGDILDAIYKFDELYNYNFLQKFENIDILRADRPQIFLGGGAGFVSKTLVYPIMGKTDGLNTAVKIFNNTVKSNNKNNRTNGNYDNKRQEPSHEKDKKLGVSPRVLKLTEYDGQTLQMGLCEFQIDEVN